jgi:hypothetical protein
MVMLHKITNDDEITVMLVLNLKRGSGTRVESISQQLSVKVWQFLLLCDGLVFPFRLYVDMRPQTCNAILLFLSSDRCPEHPEDSEIPDNRVPIE